CCPSTVTGSVSVDRFPNTLGRSSGTVRKRLIALSLAAGMSGVTPSYGMWVGRPPEVELAPPLLGSALVPGPVSERQPVRVPTPSAAPTPSMVRRDRALFTIRPSVVGD